jgi:hypothetical protein
MRSLRSNVPRRRRVLPILHADSRRRLADRYPIRPCPFWARTTTTTRAICDPASATRACTITLRTFSLACPCPTPPHYPVGPDLMWVRAHRLRRRAQATQGNKPMSTSESRPNAQPTSSLSSSKAICTFNKCGTSHAACHEHCPGQTLRGLYACHSRCLPMFLIGPLDLISPDDIDAHAYI